MQPNAFETETGVSVTAVTTEEMRDVDRVAVETIGLALLQMMENAGRTLAWHARELAAGPIVVVAGNGGNGGGGMASARHLTNHECDVTVVLDRPPTELSGAAARQYRILDASGVPVYHGEEAPGPIADAETIVDALVGYGLSGPVRGDAQRLIAATEDTSAAVCSLDIPSGRDATTGAIQGVAVEPDRTITLALPKTGMDATAGFGALYLADIAIPAAVYDRLEIPYDRPFGDRMWIRLYR